MIPRLRALSRAAVTTAAVAALSVAVLPGAVDRGGSAPPAPRTFDDPISLTGGGNPVTPGNFNGYGFDQCEAPNQHAMNRWLNRSPFLAVGIYIAGDQRYCREQANLTPRWVRTQLRKGWKLLPIILGPQASCQPRFPRWGGDSINWRPENNYGRARRQGRQEARTAAAAAQRLGIARGSTLFYDLEGFDDTREHCRKSAMAFLNAWTWKIRRLGYKSGVYSSAGSGIQMLDRARVTGSHLIPDQIWIADWDGRANTSTSYISEKGWRPGGRLKQYRGGHHETHGGVTINIDSNYVDLGRGLWAPPETICKNARENRANYRVLKHPASGAKQRTPQIQTLQCFLQDAGYYEGPLDGVFDRKTRTAANSWRRANGFRAGRHWWRSHWVALLSDGNRHALKIGSAGDDVRRLQRALNAADPTLRHRIDGRYDRDMRRAVNDYRKRGNRKRTGIADWGTWARLQAGRRG